MNVAKQRTLMSAKARSGWDSVPLSEYLGQKKEMFRTELKNRTVSAEIRQLKDKETCRRHALGESTLELEQDKKSVIEFVQ